MRPFRTLDDHCISYWFDEAEIRWGDSISGKVNQGLAASRCAVVFISDVMLDKPYPRTELESVLAAEAAEGGVRVLLLLCSPDVAERISEYPFLANKRYETWSGGARVVENYCGGSGGTTGSDGSSSQSESTSAPLGRGSSPSRHGMRNSYRVGFAGANGHGRPP